MQINAMQVHHIDTPAALEAAAAGWLQRPWVTLDSEFMRVRTFYASAALFQLCDGESCYLVDPLAIADLEPLARVLRAPGIIKIMHSCSEDLEVCERRLGALPEPLVDTQIMAAFCGHGLSVGYAKMLVQELAVVLDKSETRTDWLQRPLSPAQLSYAAEDVAYLPRLWEVLRLRLDGQPRFEWATEECAATLSRFRQRGTHLAYRDVAGAWHLDSRALAVLQALCLWREDTARRKDLPRNWVLPDAALMEVANLQPRRIEQLASATKLEPAHIRRHGAQLVECVVAGLALPESELPPRLPAPLDSAQNRLVKSMRGFAERRATEIGIATEMLARRRDFEELLRACASDGAVEQLAIMQGWRRVAIGEELLHLARGGTQ